jgi:methylated-DNA-protein-cysteine methyltransferase related protein
MGAKDADIKSKREFLLIFKANMQSSGLKETIWQIVAAIPAGNVATYGQIASLAGFPGHARYVGTTLKNLPHDTRLPWHRVVNGKGQLSFPADSQPWHKQKSRLEAEGIVFIGNGFSLKQFQWQA